MNLKAVVPLVVALCLGTVAAVVGRNMIARNRQGGPAAAAMTRAVVARADLIPGAVIRDVDIGVREVPAAGLPTGLAFADARDVVGRVVTTQVVKDQVVLATLLAPKGSGGGLQAMVPPGLRAVTLEVNEFSGLAGLLTPGARVDVVQTIESRGGDAPTGKLARIIVENLRVLAVGRRTSTASAGQGPSSDVDPGPAKSVTLLATTGQAEAIDLASHVGIPRLVLRNGADEGVTRGAGTTLAELLGDGADKPSATVDAINSLVGLFRNLEPATRPIPDVRPEPIAARPRYRQVEVIRGGASTSVRVDDRGTTGESDVVGGVGHLDRVVPSDP